MVVGWIQSLLSFVAKTGPYHQVQELAAASAEPNVLVVQALWAIHISWCVQIPC